MDEEDLIEIGQDSQDMGEELSVVDMTPEELAAAEAEEKAEAEAARKADG